MRSEKKLMMNVSQRINSIMNRVDKALRAKYGNDKEFYGILLANKDNPWILKDIIIPKQKVTGTSIIVPKDGMHAPYQKHFEESIAEGKDRIVVGTIHSHNSMNCFFSGGDDEDLDNNSCFNLNEGLPFIDIVWSNKDNSYKGRVRLKVGKGESKQIFTHDNCECVIAQDNYSGNIISSIKDRILQEFKYTPDNDFTLEENKLKEELSKAIPNAINSSLIPNVNFEEILNNIEVEYSNYSYNGLGRSYENSYNYNNYGRYTQPVATYQKSYLDKGGNVEVEVSDYNEVEQLLMFKCKGLDKAITDFTDMLESGLGQWFDKRSTIYLGDNITIELKCESKKRYKKMRKRIEYFHSIFQRNGDDTEKKVVTTQATLPMTDEEYNEAFHDGYADVPIIDKRDINYML